MTQAPPGSFRELLRNRRFVVLWSAQLVSVFGDFLAVMALFSLLAFRNAGTPGQVSGIMVAFILPLATVGPLAGVWVDRWPLKRTLVASDLARAALAASLALADALPEFYALIFALSLVSCFFLPAQAATLPHVVARDQLLLANAVNSQTMNLNKVVAPAAAGLLVGVIGERACFLLDAGTFAVSAALLASVRLARPSAASARGLGPFLRDLRHGLGFLWSNRPLATAALLTVGALLSTGVFDGLIAVYVRDVLGDSTRTFTTVVSLVGAGTLAGGVLLARYQPSGSRVRMVALGIAGLGLGVLPLAASRSRALALAGSLAIGLAVAWVIVPAQALFQEVTPPSLLGRVSSVYVSLITTAKLAGTMAAGTLAAALGIRGSYALVCLLLLAVGMAGLLLARGTAEAALAGQGAE